MTCAEAEDLARRTPGGVAVRVGRNANGRAVLEVDEHGDSALDVVTFPPIAEVGQWLVVRRWRDGRVHTKAR